jgi:KDO2-lipid IV(A) lauroyltransferase
VRLAFGRALGRLGWLLDRRHRRVALLNLERGLPERDALWRGAAGRGSFEHLGRLLVEILLQERDAPRAMSRTRVEGWGYLQEAARSQGGYFLVSGHFGNWEWVAHLQAAMGYPLWMVTRPLDNPYLERFFAGLRESTGNRVVHKRNATREMLKGLKEGRGIAFILDQNMGEPGHVFVNFFGRPAATTPTMGSLAARRGVPVLPVFAYPEPGGGYRVVYGPPVRVPDTGDREADAMAITAEATLRLEAAVRACPQAWFWMHRRWRTRPDGPDEV